MTAKELHPGAGFDVNAWIEDRQKHGEHVVIALAHLPRPFIVHPGCGAECDIAVRGIAPTALGVFVPVVDERGLLNKPDHAPWDAVVAAEEATT